MSQRRNGMFKKNTTQQNTVTHPTIADILNSLKDCVDPIDGSNLLEKNRFSGITLNKGIAQVCLLIKPDQEALYQTLSEDIKKRLLAIPGVTETRFVLTAHTPLDHPTPQHTAISRGQFSFPNIKNIIAVGSGKGGVGKSTVSVNLAISLLKMGYSVGLLDADIYGPSIPTLLDCKGQPDVTPDKKLIPLNAHGLKTMSMGYMVDDDTPVIWRGPMIQSALQKFLNGVDWGNLDFLIIDLPPGTGDVQLTLIQKAPLSGAVIVSTPQDVALIDAKKALKMFQKVDVPILGMIENMSFFECPCCKSRTPIFSQHGVEKEALSNGIDLLGHVPLELSIRESCDKGVPYSMTKTQDLDYFANIAKKLCAKLDPHSC